MSEEKMQKKITVPELRSWLEGVQELQGDDWTPTPDQWKKILAKIANLQENQEIIQSTHKAFDEIRTSLGRLEQALRFNRGGPAPTMSEQLVQPAPGPAAAPPVFVPPVSAIDNVGPVDALGRPVGGSKLSTVMPGTNPQTVKTPDSGPNYNTPFA